MTNYSNTQQRWEKIFINTNKIAENIFHENSSPWMAVRYDDKKAVTENYSQGEMVGTWTYRTTAGGKNQKTFYRNFLKK
ncbi:MAG: hypothetical protein AAFZ15_15435 [Bacteroidota bacterium]